MKKRTLRTLTLIWAAIVVAMASSTATLFITSKTGATRWVTQKQYETVERYARLDEVRETLMTDYYEPLDEDALILGAIHGMTDAVDDPYTFYYTPDEMAQSRETSEGAYRGIGVLIQATEAGEIRVVRVYPDTPAEAAGIEADDVIVAVDGTPVSGEEELGYSEAIALIRGEDGTTVALTLKRGEETLEVECTRGDVHVSYASHTMLEGDIGYLSITQFTGDAEQRFNEALDDFTERGAKGLIIDLRNNPGGLLDQVVAMADRLLPQGTIVYIQDRDGTRKDYYSDDDMVDFPLVVLVNEVSASASEIMASAVQCFGRGMVVGTTTYGKGIVQTILTYEDDGAGLQLTTASYYDGSGRSIHKTGVTPDVEVAFEGASIPLDPDPENDNQLAAALAIIADQAAAPAA